MLTRFGHLLLALALLGATGGHWVVLQGVAWTQMIVERTGHETLSAALKETLGGANPCTLCKHIAAGRQSERQPKFPASAGKLEFTCASASHWIFPPATFMENLPMTENSPRFSEPPPVPPPRTRAA